MSKPESKLESALIVGHEQPPVGELRPDRTVRHVPLKPHQYTERITPTSDVFVLGHVGIPRARADDWWLDISGLVESPCRLSFAQLLQLPKKEITVLHECAGFPMNPKIATRRYANVVWGGVDLATLLEHVGIRPEASFMWSFGLDRGQFEDVNSSVYVKDMPLTRLAKGDVLLAYEINGTTLSSEHGFPLRLIIPGYYGTNAVKWLYRIEFAATRPAGPFTTKYYNDPVAPTAANPHAIFKPVWEIAPESIIVAPAQNAVISSRTIEIWGWAWAEAGVEHVEVSVDGGESWTIATLEPGDRWAWRRFRFEWHPPSQSKYILMSRVTDQRGEVQPLFDRRNSIHSLTVTVG